MRNFIAFALALSLGATAACVGGGSGSSGGSGTGTGTGTGADATGGTDTAGGGGGDNTKNTAQVSGTGDGGQKTEVKVDKPAAKNDATAQSNKNGAMNAGKILNLYMSDTGDGGSEVLSVIIDTEKVGIPGTGIGVGKSGDSVYVTFVVATAGGGASYTSTGKGTIDITTCPGKDGQAVVGKFNGVEVAAEAVVGNLAKSITFNGPFNLVYWGGAGELQCKKVDPPPADAGSTDTGGGSTGGSCKSDDFCDKGQNKTRNCCPHIECIVNCNIECASGSMGCAMSCGGDPSCAEKCAKDSYICANKCFASCNVNATCLAASKKLDACMVKNGCDKLSDAAQDACTESKCCAEMKAVF
ncbi:MAG: hypothetical protein FJ100_20575 [Deltaproteobacteria bacterium]|nr:hypothetical protein [Deltaproteobacteria bacterium]